MSSPQVWEVWHARFDYEGGSGYKYRPVIVVGTRGDGMLAAMVTSVTNKLRMEHDVLLEDWRQAGLDRPSIARADRVALLPAGYVGSAGRIGRLSERDAASVAAALEAAGRQ